MAKRQPKPEPFSIAELEEIAQSPALQGFEKVLQYRPVLIAEPPTTVEVTASSTVEDQPPRGSEAIWKAEGAAGVFTSSRIKAIERAEDALTPVEQAVYDALWGPKRPDAPEEPYRLARMGYSELAKQSHVSKRSIQSVIDRLIHKRFIAVETPADITTRRPTTYRVMGYGAVLNSLRETGRMYVLRTGRGVFYAHPMDSTQ